MFVWTLDDVITLVLLGLLLLLLIIIFITIMMAKLIEFFSRWRPYKREKMINKETE